MGWALFDGLVRWVGILVYIFNWPSGCIFFFNCLAIIPLANLLKLIISVFALRAGEIKIVQSSMLGSIISNILLVLGTCFLTGGIKYKTQKFNQTAAQTSSSLMTLACISLIIPATFNFSLSNDNKETLLLSRGTAIILLLVYMLHLLFQLKTHSHLYNEEQFFTQDGEQVEEPQLSLISSIIFLIIITVNSFEGVVKTLGFTETFIGLIILPIVGNAAEHVTAVIAARKDKINIAISIAVGSSMQVSLLIMPILVILSWIINQQMSLLFNSFETIILFISVLITNYIIQDRESNWLEGVMLLATYIIIGWACYLYNF
ncbi:Sodium/calcium exchanger protein [Gigaspora rosea]|uniref:Vacuolar calcium ion transporter n=1 Tax=Gigaspora rosea TaxID=44941 RepID=A0A397V6X5_9GLOM|nr:Sodium/calcium exchanger protein [Gigaspora rosea]